MKPESEKTAAVVGSLLLERGKTLGVAESCTGGLLGSIITDIAGSSAWFRGGVISYNNELKEKLLGVDKALMVKHGVVSEPVVKAMALGVAKATGSNIGIGISGIAGPGGGTADKPVGTVYIGMTANGEATAKHFLFNGNRRAIREQSAIAALEMVRYQLDQKVSGDYSHAKQ